MGNRTNRNFENKMYCDIAVNYPRNNSILTYKNSKGVGANIGDLVEVPLGRRKELGCVIGFRNESDVDKSIKYKEITRAEYTDFNLSLNELELYKWCASYYMYSLGKLIFDSLPKYMKRIKDPEFIDGKGDNFPFDLNSDQLKIISSFDTNRGFSQSLIHGVTGSGKSLVFLSMMKKVIDSGKSVQYLLPEINLTTQFIKFFSEFLGCKIFTYHSSIKNSQKFNLWRYLKTLNEPVLIIGVRSSVFLPVKNLGLIVIDEEHDKSFKQDDRCRFHARDVAIKKAQIGNFPIVLGSATPTLENFYRFKNNEKLNYFTLKERFNNSKLPSIELVNCPAEEDDTYPISKEVIEKLRISLKAGFQSIVFVNKLGFSKYIQCHNCGQSFDCPNCDIRLTNFKSRNTLECYACEYKDKIPKLCPSCGCIDLYNGGFGTEKVEKVLKKIFSEKVIEKFDRDNLKNLADVEKVLERFEKKEINILVGTQMISKGHNFKNVDSVVILGIDSYLHIPDFRSAERMFQQIRQVSGRAGRFGEDANVYLQSDLRPKFFEFIVNHDFDSFYLEELKVREKLKFPPFSKLIKIEGKSHRENDLYHELTRVKKSLKETFENKEILGPAPGLIRKIGNKYHYHLLVKDQRFKIDNNFKGLDIRYNVDP